jgi:His-Xaa-Ser repeat protein HxsA
VIIGPWFYPWGYGYYPYASYSYYDDRYYNDRYYDDGYAASEDARSDYADSSVSQVQAALAREGYYHGAIDGSIGPATRNALRRYQRNQGLDATGRIDRAVIEALGLG